MSEKSERRLEALERELRFLSDIGADFIFASTEQRTVRIKPQGREAGPLAEAIPRPQIRRMDRMAASKILRELDRKILTCTLCPLSRERTHAVPGEGHEQAELMFVGEGPGADEDIRGKPFIGRAGQLLTRIIAAMGFNRQDVYITNVVKCRPPKNRTPFRGEIEACRPFLTAQIEAIAPKVIVSLGKVATDFFHPSPAGMSKRRGQFVEFGKILVMPTFHPSYLIRNEGDKELRKRVWQDMQQVMAILNE